MNIMTKRSFVVALAVGVFALASFSSEAKPKLTEDQLIAELSGSNPDKVADAMLQLERNFPTSTKFLPKVKELLTDPRDKVRRKAGRVLGALHAEVSQADLKNIAAMLKASDSNEVIDALKSLRGLEAKSTVPEIIPLLQNSVVNVVRDALRTLAVLGDKSNVSDVEPLLKHSDAKVQKDAMDALHTLKAK
jgi:hypothetical protein